jgi:chromosome segregation ATPase
MHHKQQVPVAPDPAGQHHANPAATAATTSAKCKAAASNATIRRQCAALRTQLREALDKLRDVKGRLQARKEQVSELERQLSDSQQHAADVEGRDQELAAALAQRDHKYRGGAAAGSWRCSRLW